MDIDPTGFADRMDMGCERKRSVEDDSRFWLERWKSRVAITLMRKTAGRASLKGLSGGLSVGHVKFEMPVRHLSRDTVGLGFRKEVLAKDVNL